MIKEIIHKMFGKKVEKIEKVEETEIKFPEPCRAHYWDPKPGCCSICGYCWRQKTEK